ncbi:L-histidine N(alpha)-methyltransferase [Curvibacter sp. HBC28]|uniref:L-histidine N(Alpha)-methyltransferase n=1 Tax=Curvibacter microcysteis TaxID=3026419 RepID=A0ABT5MJN0_9BURK|nr:L-histidine N(alpha)-methyltransferase [Curvibacter sp. HBC28]MDD0816785.1 L-histidine N(alpha)-methyltransferase [Curvibacter sp. HBC28]
MSKVGPMHQWNSAHRSLHAEPLPWALSPAPTAASSPELNADAFRGLQLTPRNLPGRYLFDLEGCTLFDRATETPDYYLARTELSVVHAHASEIARRMGPCPELVEWGAGAMRVIRRLIEETDQPVRYLPIDLSAQHLQAQAAGLQHDYPRLDIQPLLQSPLQAQNLPARHPQASRRMGLLGGAALASVPPEQRLTVLRHMAQALRGGALLATVDQVQEADVLKRAYNDAQGLMARFNQNALLRCRRELNLQGEISGFRHQVSWSPIASMVQLQLISSKAQTWLLGQGEQRTELKLLADEPINTLRSFQWSANALQSEARLAGFSPGPCWQDPQARVALCWLQAPPV